MGEFIPNVECITDISMRTFCETLYCAYVPPDAFAVASDGRIAFGARVTDADQTAEHHVEFSGVRDLVRRRDLTAGREPGDEIELSVIEIEHGPSEWRVWLNPWYLEEVEFHCARILLDEAEIVGDGRWLQDELPTGSAG